MDIVANAFVTLWVNAHGSPKIVSADVEFISALFKDMLRDHGYSSKKGLLVVTTKSGLLSLDIMEFACLSKRLLKDAEYNLEKCGLSIPKQEILSKATFCAIPSEVTLS